jgi:hypothetical protein
MVRVETPSGHTPIEENVETHEDETLTVLWPRQQTTARCEKMLDFGFPIKSAKLRARALYYTPPWPIRRQTDYDVVALIENGRAVNWVTSVSQ